MPAQRIGFGVVAGLRMSPSISARCPLLLSRPVARSKLTATSIELVRSFHRPWRNGQTRIAPSLLLASKQWQTSPTTTALTLSRSVSIEAIPRRRSRIVRFFLRTLVFSGFVGLTVTAAVVAFFIYDATTYRSDPEKVDIPVPELALHPRRGGPKDLPIAEYLIDDEDDPERTSQVDKPRLVILGGGWGVSAHKDLGLIYTYVYSY